MKTCPTCGGDYDEALRFCPRDGEVLEDSPQALVGRVLDGQYEIEAYVASGGMGTIYRARHIMLGDRVALKTLKPEMQSNGEWLRRFQREGRAARRFRHPNSVTVYDLRTSADGLVYMVMEFVEGETLDRELERRGRFTPAAALDVLEPVARALEAAHAQGVVHRDLKPENVMLARDADGSSHVKLLDLGIAKLRDIADTRRLDSAAAALTMAGQVLGTPYYMSPEQWGEIPRDGSSEIDGRADIYSLGVMFYELVAGRRPFGGKTLAEFRHAHVVASPPPLDRVDRAVPERFAHAVERAMAKDRADRFQAAGDFVAELRAALSLPDEDGADAPTPEHSRTLVRDETLPASAAAEPWRFAGPTGVQSGGAESRRRFSEPSEVNLTAPTVRIDDADAARPLDEAAAAGESQPPAAGAAAAAARAARDRYETVADLKLATRSAEHVKTARDAEGGARLAGVGESGRFSELTAAPLLAPHVAPSRSRRAPLVAAGVAVVVLLLVCVVGVAGWFALSRWQAARAGVVEPTPAPAPPPAVVAPPATAEAVSYWIEAFEAGDEDAGERVARAGAITLASGQQFKFHFSPRERGYLYIVGPGRGNAPTTFLTAQPAGVLKTNVAAAGSDFTYPYGEGQVLELDRNPGTEEYTVIFSSTPLLEPAFLAARSGRELSPAELKELEDLRARAQTGATGAAVKDAGGAASVAVSAPVGGGGARLVVFDIRIEHQ